MKRLTAYLVKAFAADALALFGVTLLLLWLVQCLRIFDVISVKGQNLWVLAGQSALALPPLAVVFMYVCMGIGVARTLRAFQLSHELHIIHASRRVPALIAATAIFAAGGIVAVLVLSNFVEPYSARQLKSWTAEVAADLVGRTLTPHRFTQVTPGLVMVIGGREPGGRVIDFFADDRRDPETRRTYVASSATVAEDDSGYVMQLYDGRLQHASAEGAFTEIAFGRYDVALERFSGEAVSPDPLREDDTISLIRSALDSGTWSEGVVRTILTRAAEPLRIVAMCFLVLAIAGFPNARRSRWALPLEVVVLVIAFFERALSNYATGVMAPLVGAGTILVAGLILLALRFRPRRVPRELLAVPA